MKKPYTFLCVTFCVFVFFTRQVFAQCSGTPISSFPYLQDFEISAGGWISGGTNNDWAYGTPSKPVITGAGSGTKCWISGGLSNASYSNSEHGYVMSPCFDFTNLDYPFIAFKIFWETERQYDGGNLQYSLNGGSTWSNVGAYGDSLNCMTENWYNYNNIMYLNSPAWVAVKHGWSGNVQNTSGSCQGGNGSGTWLAAKHCLTTLAHKPSVRFRFTFASGSTCNAFDGLAFDDVFIGEAPANTAGFNYSCSGDTLRFSSTFNNCPTSLSWNFGDAASGTSNTSSLQNPFHVFSAPGVYNVTFTAGGPCNAPVTVSQQVYVLGITTTVSDITCYGFNNGSATTIGSGGGSYSYSWNTIPAQNSATVSNLAPGEYIVTVSSPNTQCSISDTVTISEPTLIVLSGNYTDASCGNNNGSANVSANGGTGALSYQWNTNPVQNINSISNLSLGSYTCTVTDQNGCTADTTYQIVNVGSNMSATVSTTDAACNGGSDGTATINMAGGISPYSFVWTPSVSGASTATGLMAGIYQVDITDNTGCVKSIQFTISEPLAITATASITDASCFAGSDGSILATASGGSGSYNYQWQSPVVNNALISAMPAGIYNLVITDIHGCQGQASFSISQPAVINAGLTVLNRCLPLKGDITSNTGGGVPPYNYSWSPGGGNTPGASALSDGWYKVVISDSHGCTITDSAEVHAVNGSEIDFIYDKSVSCPPLCVNYTALHLSNDSILFYQWNFGDGQTAYNTNLSHCYNNSGVYSVGLMAVNVQACTTLINKSNIIEVYPSPKADFTYDSSNVITVQTDVNFFDISEGSPVKWLWQFGDNDSSVIQHPVAVFPDTGVYLIQLVIVNEKGCRDTIAKPVHVYDPYAFYVPNSFTPDGDGLNDMFIPFGRQISSLNYEFVIFDRWGEEIFRSNNLKEGWDGKVNGHITETGVYVYKLSCEDIFKVKHTYVGIVNLLR